MEPGHAYYLPAGSSSSSEPPRPLGDLLGGHYYTTQVFAYSQQVHRVARPTAADLASPGWDAAPVTGQVPVTMATPQNAHLQEPFMPGLEGTKSKRVHSLLKRKVSRHQGTRLQA